MVVTLNNAAGTYDTTTATLEKPGNYVGSSMQFKNPGLLDSNEEVGSFGVVNEPLAVLVYGDPLTAVKARVTKAPSLSGANVLEIEVLVMLRK